MFILELYVLAMILTDLGKFYCFILKGNEVGNGSRLAKITHLSMRSHNVIPGFPIPNPVSFPQKIFSDLNSTLCFKGGISFGASMKQEILVESNLIIQHSHIKPCGGAKLLKTIH
jgi:hypothetical protein